MRQLFATLLLFWLPTSWAVAESLADFSASYSVQYNQMSVGRLEQQLTTTADGLRRLDSKTEASGLVALFRSDNVKESSVWRDHQGQIQPLEYHYERTGRRDKFLHMEFDWQQLLVHIDDKKHPWKLELQPGTLDRLIYQLAVMRDLSKGKTELSYHIADGGKLKHHEIVLLGSETVSTPLGEIEAVKLKRDRDDDNDRQTILWCAPALGYLTVKLQHIEKDGATFTASLRELEGRDTSVFSQQPRPANNPGLITNP